MLASLLDRARAAWPEVRLDAATFARHVDERLRPGESASRLHVDDLYLACACAHGLPAALAAFDARYLATVPQQLARIDRSGAFVDEVAQRLRHRLLVRDERPPRIASYSGRGPLSSFVHVATIRIALNLRRDVRELAAGDGNAPAPFDGPEQQLWHRRAANDLRNAFVAAVAALRPTDRQLLRRHFLDGMPQRTIARRDGITHEYVSRRMKTARQRLWEETRRRLALTDGENADEVMALLYQELAELDVRKLFCASRARSRVFQAGR
jgi:RNA polymerase sigma-70 factor (ECF subfamily)